MGPEADAPKLIRSGDRQRLQHHLLDQREDRRGCADAEGQSQDGDCCEALIAAKLAQGIADVPGKFLHKVSSAHCANPFLHLLDTANFDKRFSSGHRLRKPLLDLLLRQGFQR